jgi:pimeloyl-ACP methyl ester carboxylesterase
MKPETTLFEDAAQKAVGLLQNNWWQSNEWAEAWREYATDTVQRTILTWDVLRCRGNQHLEHVVEEKPPVLVFGYDTVLDGRTLDRPVNYLLLRIRPDPARPTDPAKRPIVVVDPRAGHGPGIGGFKPDSQIGLALKNGYPCYFVSFKPRPVPGQTIEDVARAEAAFLAKVAELHPEAEDRPVVIGNCQAGWAVAMLSAAAPELMSVVILNGAPLSYWAGEVGHNPMRYVGGLLGGTWLASLTSDLGDGLFDGANLVSNFEYLDPANTLWKKPYNLYSNIDDEAERYLGFERWWGGHFLLTKDEIRFITEDLFVGNKLALGDVQSSAGRRIELRNIKAPIIIFASKGDNVTPPQQALNWILDVYDSVDDIRASGQVIIYMLHESIGHLGIFVSAKVAKREHRAMIDNLDVVSTLPPGLYEMAIGDDDGGKQHIGFQRRTLDDIRGLDDSRREELFFLPVARVSERNQAAYEQFLSPWVKMVSNPMSGELLRRANPHRLVHWLWSDVNPAMSLVAETATRIRSERRPVRADNMFRLVEQGVSEAIIQGLDNFRDCRDRAVETMFYGLYAGLKQLWRDDEADLLARRSLRLTQRSRLAQEWLEREIMPLMAEGGIPEAVLRIALWLGRRRPMVDAERFRLAESTLTKDAAFAGLDSRRMRDALRQQFLLLMLDEDKAIATLPTMIATATDRASALDLVDRIATEIGGVDAQQRDDLDALRDLFATTAPGEEPRPETRPRARRRPHAQPPQSLH